MPYSESAYQASKKYRVKNIKRVPLDMQISEYDLLKSCAEVSGEKVNQYIKIAIKQRMERENTV